MGTWREFFGLATPTARVDSVRMPIPGLTGSGSATIIVKDKWGRESIDHAHVDRVINQDGDVTGHRLRY